MPVNTRVKLAPTTEKQVLKDLAGFAAGLQRLHMIKAQKWCLGYVIIITNASFHKKEVLQNLAGKYSQELIFLPPHSPEYNPIEPRGVL